MFLISHLGIGYGPAYLIALELIRDVLPILGTLVSIISLILTIFILYDTRKIRSFYRFKARGPALLKDLSKQSSDLSSYLNDFEDFLPQIAEVLKLSEAKLESLEKKVSGRQKASVNRLRKSVTECTVISGQEQEVRNVYLEMIKVIGELKEHRKDLDWEM